MRSRVRFSDFDDINLNEIRNESGQDQFFKNIKVLCKFNSKIHLVSYLHLQFINNFMLFIVIIGSFTSGLLDTIKHNEKPDKDLKLIFGCIIVILRGSFEFKDLIGTRLIITNIEMIIPEYIFNRFLSNKSKIKINNIIDTITMMKLIK